MSVPGNFNINIQHHNYFNYTFCLNQVNFLQEIVLLSDKDHASLSLEVQSSLGIFKPLKINVDQVKQATGFRLKHFPFEYDLHYIKNLNEKDLDSITVTVAQEDKVIAVQQFNIEVLPLDYFGGFDAYPQLLASYVTSNHPGIYTIKTEAIKILEANKINPSFDGYQRKSKEHVVQLCAAIYRAIQNLSLIYSSLPPSFETSGQRIRLTDKVLSSKFGNCIDISLLFAACLEAIDLNPIILITRGHAFVGVWLDDQRMEVAVNYDQAAISKRIASGIKDMALIEATMLCKGSNLPFHTAVSQAESQLMASHNFVLSVDIKTARALGIKPIPTVLQTEAATDVTQDSRPATEIDDTFEIGTLYQDLELSDTLNLSKQKVWERKLLDLSLRNSLLNLRFSKSMLQLVDINLNQLEDSLADGKAYTIHPDANNAILRKYNLYSDPLHTSHPVFQLASDEFKYGRLLTHYHKEDLDNILTHLYRSAKLAEEENGKSTLYLGLGLLKWYEPKNQSQERFAPILLIPVELSRRSVNTKFTLKSREEETMINMTLLEYLRQEYKFNLNGLETLPTDDFGVDVAKVLAIVRNAIMNLEGWDVLEQVVLGNFSFNKLILWQDISKYADKLQESAIVKSLMEGQLTQSLEDVLIDHKELELLPAHELTLPIPADNSQLNAVKSARQSRSFILHGPPGTGKSQTITNIIADALANDKKVLFVASKKAALDVVHTRLEKIGLGPFCLELHSNKSRKSDVLQQFERSLGVPKYQLNENVADFAKRMDERKAELSTYVNELHQEFAAGWTLFDTISFLENNKIVAEEQLLVPIAIDQLSKNEWHQWQDFIQSFAPVVKRVGQPAVHPLRYVAIAQHQLENKKLLTAAINSYIETKQKADIYKSAFALNNCSDNDILILAGQLQMPDINIELIEAVFSPGELNMLRNWSRVQLSFQDLEQKINEQFNTGIYSLDRITLSARWNRAKQSWFLPKWWHQRKVKAQINSLAKRPVAIEAEMDQVFSDLEQHAGLKNQLSNPQYRFVHRQVAVYLDGDRYRIADLNTDIGRLEQLKDLGGRMPIADYEQWLRENLMKNDLVSSLEELREGIKAYVAAETRLKELLSVIPEGAALKTVLIHIDQLEDWVNFNIYKGRAIALNLQWLVELIESSVLDTDNLVFEFEKVAHLNYFIKTVYGSESLNGFDARIYEAQIEQYRKLHKEYTLLNQNALIAKLSDRIPKSGQEAVQSSEIGILQRAIRNKGRGLSIRKLFDQIPTLIPRLKPCMLMSPISVAQYFDVSTEHFDLVLFDEASQLPTAEAVSALARAKQAIIVGDPKQMPPTSFFASNKTDEDNMEFEDLESILDDCLALSIPSNYLLRHYRSKHESLISFSNANFYDNKLLTFPSPDDQNRKVTFEYIQEGFYDKGKTRTNKAEAQSVINYIERHLKNKKPQSIGVVTFSQTQQSLVEDLLQQLFTEQPELEETAMNAEEPIFVKNLENVQGDERDIILFSIGYGPDETRRVSMNFGPLNRDGGWRRLNVAVTRARQEMKVFSSLKGDQIDLNRTKSEGVKGLKHFLNFAEKGIIYTDVSALQSEKRSVVDSIATALRAVGINCKTNIGASEYKIDIGIVDPRNEQQYLLAVLLDSDHYFKIHTTNDRELLAPNVLSGLGWNIYRIWTLDWIKNKDKIVADIQQQLIDIQNRKIEAPILEVKTELERKNHIEVVQEEIIPTKKVIPYAVANVAAVPDANSESIYYLEHRTVLLRQMAEIISIEAPISESMLIKKILKLWNTSRAGAKLTNHLKEISLSIPEVTISKGQQHFYWSKTINSDSIMHYRENQEEKRGVEDIAIEELSVAMLEVMENNLSLPVDDLFRVTARIFGFAKLGVQIEGMLKLTLDRLVGHGKLNQSGDKVILQRI